MQTTVDEVRLKKIIDLLTQYQQYKNPGSREEYAQSAQRLVETEKELRTIGVELDQEGSILLMRGVHLQVKKRNPILAAYLQTIWNGVGCWPA